MSIFKDYLRATKEAFTNLFTKPNTVLFPNEHVEVTNVFRGKPVLISENCRVCLKCERVCPTKAIEISKTSGSESSFKIDLGRCCYCGECEDACKFNAITLTDQWMTSSIDRSDLISIQVVNKKRKIKPLIKHPNV